MHPLVYSLEQHKKRMHIKECIPVRENEMQPAAAADC